MMRIGRVVGREIKINKDGDRPVMALVIEMTDTEDIQTVELFSGHGDDSSPVDGSLVAVFGGGAARKIAVSVNDGIAPTSEIGEKYLYSIASGVVSAFIKLLVNGNIEINGNTDNAVRYSALETAFNQFKSDYNSHTHGGVGPSPQTVADITPSKVDEVLLP